MEIERTMTYLAIITLVIHSVINRQPYCREMRPAHRAGIFIIMKNVSFPVLDSQVLLSFSLRFTHDR